MQARLVGATRASLLRGAGETFTPWTGRIWGSLFESLAIARRRPSPTWGDRPRGGACPVLRLVTPAPLRSLPARNATVVVQRTSSCCRHIVDYGEDRSDGSYRLPLRAAVLLAASSAVVHLEVEFSTHTQ